MLPEVEVSPGGEGMVAWPSCDPFQFTSTRPAVIAAVVAGLLAGPESVDGVPNP